MRSDNKADSTGINSPPLFVYFEYFVVHYFLFEVLSAADKKAQNMPKSCTVIYNSQGMLSVPASLIHITWTCCFQSRSFSIHCW